MEKNYGYVDNDIDTDVVILCNGEYPVNDIPLKILKNAHMVVCCDGAANNYIGKGNMPYAIIGDGDSLSDNIKKNYANLLIKISEQETNDLTKAVIFLVNRGVKEFAIVGATGKREDHTIGNISLLLEYQKMGVTTAMYTDFGYFVPVSNDSSFKSYPGQQISVFNDNATDLSSHELLYPIYNFNKMWQGTLNESLADIFNISAKGDYIVYLNY